jgi:hypothetical protein
MRIAIDIDTGSVRTWAGQPISALAGKRGDQYPVHVRYERGGAIIERPTGATGILGVKLASDPTGNFVALAGSWTKTGSGAQTVYLFSLNLNTTELETAFSTDPDSVFCVLEIETVAPGELISSATIPLEISNDVIRGNEGVPTDAMDPYPLPSAIELKAEKGQPNGYASLDAGGKVPASQLALVASQISDSTAASRELITGPESSVPLFRLDLTALTGGGPTALDGIATTTLTPPRALFLIRPNEPLACYQLEAGTAAESVPNIIRPDDFHAGTNAKIWVRKL